MREPWRERQRANEKAKYHDDPEYRRKKNESVMAARRCDNRTFCRRKRSVLPKRPCPDCGWLRALAQKLAKARERYATDPEYRERQRAKGREQRLTKAQRERKNALARERYRNSPEYRAAQKRPKGQQYRPPDCKGRVVQCRRHQRGALANSCRDCGWCDPRRLPTAPVDPTPESVDPEPEDDLYNYACACGQRVSGDCQGRLVSAGDSGWERVVRCRFDRPRIKSRRAA